MHLNDERIFPVKQRLEQIHLPPDHAAVIRMQHKQSVFLEMVEGRRKNVIHTILEGMGCQVYAKNGGSALVSADEISPAALEECLHKALALCPQDAEKRDVSAETLFAAEPETAKRFLSVAHGSETLSVAQAGEALLGFHRELMPSDRDISCATSLSVAEDEWRILRSDGTDVHFTTPRSLFRHEMSGWSEGKNTSLAVVWVGNDFSPVAEEEQKEIIRGRVNVRLGLLRELIAAPPAPYGSYPILIDAHLTGGLVHEAFGHAAESDSVFKGSILGENGRFRKGLRVGPETLSITDGPVEYDWGDQPFSANGFPRKTMTIVDRGILRQPLADLFTAGPVGSEPTGAERAEDFRSPPIPRMSNIRLEVSDAFPWECDFEDLSAQELYDFLLRNRLVNPSEEHLYLSGYRGGQVNSASGDFVFNCSMIYRLKDGRATLHKPAIFSGNIFAVLGSVRLGIGRQHIRRSGMCGKSGQRVPTSGGGPLFTLIDPHPEIRIGGR